MNNNNKKAQPRIKREITTPVRRRKRKSTKLRPKKSNQETPIHNNCFEAKDPTEPKELIVITPAKRMGTVEKNNIQSILRVRRKCMKLWKFLNLFLNNKGGQKLK